MAHKYISGTIIPDHFLPGIGYVVVQQTQLDHAVNEMIWFLAEVDPNEGRTITSAIINLKMRLELFRRLTIVNVIDEMDRKKLQAIAIRAGDLATIRNRIEHDRPDSYDKAKDEITFIREENLTDPQIKDQPPTLMTKTSLRELGDEMIEITKWLGLYLPRFPNRKHPDWNDDALFPWPDILQRRLGKPGHLTIAHYGMLQVILDYGEAVHWPNRSRHLEFFYPDDVVFDTRFIAVVKADRPDGCVMLVSFHKLEFRRFRSRLWKAHKRHRVVRYLKP